MGRELSLKARLLQRGALERIAEELRQQVEFANDHNNVLYSTQERAGKGYRLDSEEYRRKVGIVSGVSRGHNPHSGVGRGTNRTGFYQFGGASYCDQDVRGRTLRK